MMKEIKSALLSCFSKGEGLLHLARYLRDQNVIIYSTGGTSSYLSEHGIPSIRIEDLTRYPSLLGGRVKTLHPLLMGGILARRDREEDKKDIQTYEIPLIDLVAVDLYPFEDTVLGVHTEGECIEKIDIGGVALLRAAAKNFAHCVVICEKEQYKELVDTLSLQGGSTSAEQRKSFAARAFAKVALYDAQIAAYFNPSSSVFIGAIPKISLRYGENPHQQASFYGSLDKHFTQLNGKRLSYNNLLDIDSSFSILNDIPEKKDATFWGIVKHTNICGAAIKSSSLEAWRHALGGDSESAFGGILFTNKEIDPAVAGVIDSIFFEVVIAPSYTQEALALLCKKKNRIVLLSAALPQKNRLLYTPVLEGMLEQEEDVINYQKWEVVSKKKPSDREQEDLLFANILCKHLKSNAIVIVKNQSLIGKGCGQTSRIDALRQAVQKAKQFDNDLRDSALASDAFFPFDDCVRMAKEEGISCFVQPGGSIRDEDSIRYCDENGLSMICTGARHFKH